ncbi:MAG: hemolysin family protein [Clostridiales bacterium]|nr:hemolysin family protein [Clostridiales bacterium]MDY4172057.1 hemolysin family protein [Evtepia sp.]
MQAPALWPLLLQVILIALNAVFACAEIAVISVNDNKLAQLVAQGDKRALRLARLTSRPAQFLATIQIAITLSGFLGSAFAADNFSDQLAALLVRAGVPLSEKALDTIAVVLITLLLSYFTLVFGELVPKRLAMKKSESLALGLSTLISAISTLFAPIVAILTASTNGILRLLGIDPSADEEEVSEEEIKMMVDRGSQKGVFDSATKEFITNIFEFDDRTVGEFATHRTELDLLWTNQTVDTWKQILLDTRHTRYPVCDGSVDQVIGILDARDFFRFQDSTLQEVLEGAVKPAFFVPETVKADVLFQQMKGRRTYYAVVLDEHGGMLGVVTIRDLLEQLVGEIQQEGELPEIEALEGGTWRIQGSAPLDDVARALGIPLPLEEYETFGGYVFGLYGSVPQDGRRVGLKTDHLEIQMTRIQQHRLEEALVTLLPAPEQAP